MSRVPGACSFLVHVLVATALLVLGTAGIARADTLRILVAVGHNQGLPHEIALKHADRDAQRVRDVFVAHGGVTASAAFLLQDPSLQALSATIDRASALARTRPARDVSLLFYFSGHGDRSRVHLGREVLEVAALDQKLAAFPARLKLLVVDACRVSEGRIKGATTEEPFTIQLDASDGAAGTVRLHASADGDVAQESDELGGAIFTHYWLVGLLGAADDNRDGQVTLAESYAHAQAQTLLRTARSAGVVQRPQATFDLREATPVVLTQVGRTSAIGLPQGADTYYLVYGSGSRSVLAEIWASPDRTTFAAVPPGAYLVHRRAPGHGGALQLTLASGERRALTASDFAPVAEERLARKGGTLDLAPHELELAYGLSSGTLAEVGHAVSVGYARAWDELALSLALGAGVGQRSGPAQSSEYLSGQARLLAEWRLVRRPWTLRVGAGPSLGYVAQTVVRDDAARVVAAGYAGERRAHALLAGAAGYVGLRFAVAGPAFVELGGSGYLQATEVGGAAAAVVTGGGSAAAGLEF